ncbi:MAG: UvrD-helicase domain-containing protein [Elusimicrobia bacterium]|nr:UvrD-helicase domain-containing protein [Elusimicrobiota bacterium]
MALNLEDLNEPQRAAVLHEGGPLLVLAGAGTGKTRVITCRVARLIESGVPADRILAVTFTNKAAGEMRKRIAELSPGAGALVWVYTFHSFCCRVLRRHHEKLNLTQRFTIYDEDDQKRTIVEAMKALGLEKERNKAGIYAHIISRAKDDLLDAGSYEIHSMTSPDPSRQTAARIYAVYQRMLDAAGALDFGDLLLKTCELLRNCEDVRDYYQKYFVHVLVDEYQDTNHAQYVLTRTLAGLHRNLAVVGDDDQGIYSWRGANIRNILEFERDFGETRVVTLEQNYRSTPRILEAAVSVIKYNKNRKPKTLWTRRMTGDPIEAMELPNEVEEARWVVGRIQGLVEGGRGLRDLAVFYRTNAQSRAFEETLRSARIPYRIVGAMRFYERKEVKDLLSYARAVINPEDSAALTRIINVPPRGIGKTSLDSLARRSRESGLSLWRSLKAAEGIHGLTPACRRAVQRLVGLLEHLAASIADRPPSIALETLIEAGGIREWLEADSATDPEAAGRLENVAELVNAAKDYEARLGLGGESADLARYLEEVALQSDIDAYDADVPAVTLMTVHLAKGLEFPVVFLTGLEEGLFPFGSNATPSDLEEERRLCYVGMTRAREKLLLTHAGTRRLFGHVFANLPSRFIFEAQLAQGAPDPALGRSAGFRPVRGYSAGSSDAVPARVLAAMRVGMRVRHPSFGAGLVTETSGSGKDARVTVRFDDGRTTKLLVRYAPLEPA